MATLIAGSGRKALDGLLRRSLDQMREVRDRLHAGAASRPEVEQVFKLWNRVPQCEALQRRDEIAASSRVLAGFGLPSHHDSQKDWDSLKALYQVLRCCDSQAPILDAGSGAQSVILGWLCSLGYSNLSACDRVGHDTATYDRQSIKFSVEDLAQTGYGPETYAAITCISVIEHGVNLDSFFREVHRILKPGGILALSTDYWPESIDCSGVYPYGEEFGEMKIFSRSDIDHMLGTANDVGLELTSPIDFTVDEKAVRWERVNRDYTFLFAALQKRS